LSQYQIIICIPLCTMSSDNSNDDDDNNDNNHGVPTSSRDRLGGKGSFDNNDNYTDHYRRENQLPSLVPRMNKRQERMCAEKRVCDLEYDLRQLEADNKRLKVELKFSKKKYRHLSKEDIRTYNEWTFDEANLANKINDFSRDVMFQHYKFLKEGWQDYKLSNQKSLSYFVGQKMADTYQNMRILTSGREFEDQWDRVYVPVIEKKYQNMRNNIGNNIRETYFRELHDQVHCLVLFVI
jgi:hypothetical protein